MGFFARVSLGTGRRAQPPGACRKAAKAAPVRLPSSGPSSGAFLAKGFAGQAPWFSGLAKTCVLRYGA